VGRGIVINLCPLIESLEARRLFSALAFPQAEVLAAVGASSPYGRTPAQIRKSYGVDSVDFNGVVGDGSGQTIALIDAYDNPSMVSSSNSNFVNSDLHRFDVQFGLPDPPSFIKVNQSGSTNYPAFDAGWAGEIALDVEWAHAIAPGANILLVEASSATLANLNSAVSWAKDQPGVTAISMSYNGPESPTESSRDSFFTTPAGHAGITFFAAAGDEGSAGSSQTYSPNVVAVGGTTLNQADSSGTYGGETAWSLSGGGISQYERKPAYQYLVTTPSSTMRTVPDVAADADTTSGVAVFDTSDAGVGSAPQWFEYAGTSLAAPIWAGVVSIANQGRALRGLDSLDGPTQTLPRLYSLSSFDFHDITSGNNGGFSAGPGYDAVTGRGSPVGNVLIPDLAGAVTLSGTAFNDAAGDGAFGSGDTGISGVTVFVDLNHNGALDSGEPSDITDSGGRYSFSDLLGGVGYTVREIAPAGQTPTTQNPLMLGGSYGQSVNGNFGSQRPVQSSFSGSALTLALDAGGNNVEIYNSSDASGSPAYSIPRGELSTLTFTGTAGGDVFTIDLANGNPLLGINASYNGLGSSDTIIVRGSSSADNVIFSSTGITIGGRTLSVSGVENATFDGRGGYDSVAASNFAVNFANSQLLQSLSLSGNSAATLAPGGNLLYTRSLSVSSTAALNLNDGALIDDDPSGFAAITSLLTTGYHGGAWDGAGINSSSAHADSGHSHALGYARASDLGLSSFMGQSVSPGGAIVRYTIYGDANLDGVVDIGNDFALLLDGVTNHANQWLHGDFNYDGVVDTAHDVATLLNNIPHETHAVASAPSLVYPAIAATPFAVAPLISSPLVLDDRDAVL
jgi:hypothetical protein